MSPSINSKYSNTSSFPRVSGDEPKKQYPKISLFMFSPRERG